MRSVTARSLALTLSLGFFAPLATAQDAPPAEKKKEAPAAPKVDLPADPAAAIEFMRGLNTQTRARGATKEERSAARAKLQEAARQFLEVMPGKATDEQLETGLRTYRFTHRKGFDAAVASLAANDKVSERFKSGLKALTDFQESANLISKVFRVRRQKAKTDEEKAERTKAADAIRDQVYAAVKAWLEKHATTAFGSELGRALRELRFNATRLKDEVTYDAWMTKLKPELAKLPERVRPMIVEHFVKVGAPAPAWSATSFKGAEISNASLKGKVVLLDFWASWCGPCVALIKKRLIPLQEKFADVTIVGLGSPWRSDTVEKQKAMAEKLGANWTKAFDTDAKAAKAYGVTGLPYLVLVDEEGKILAKGSGWAAIKDIEAVLSKRAGASAPEKAPAKGE